MHVKSTILIYAFEIYNFLFNICILKLYFLIYAFEIYNFHLIYAFKMHNPCSIYVFFDNTF